MKRLPVLLIALLAALGLFACGSTETFEVTQGDEKTYAAEFTDLRTTRTHDLLLEEQDVLEVEVFHEAGSIKLTIEKQEGGEVYTGNLLESGAFTVGIAESGTYIVTVEGEKADGSLRIAQKS